MTKPKRAHELTTQGAMRRLFPKEVRDMMREEIAKADSRRGKSTRESQARGKEKD